MQAFAAETAHDAAHGAAHAFYEEPTFWVLVAFVILIVAVGKPVFRAITKGLDERADLIKAQIDEAVRLREEAQETLASFQRKQRDAAKEAEEIVARAKAEAARLAEKAAADLESSLKRREKQAMDRIAQAEAQAVEDVRNAAIEVAVSATRRLLTEQIDEAKADTLIDAAIKDLPGKLH
ncbi:MAG: F0F1 ATP synthase subunit B [Hyphomicrobiales bacterium]|nr:F0F1 ATP synthase subunit B [Hyphomicrobiales bacterium]